jgi:hypothetical protein
MIVMAFFFHCGIWYQLFFIWELNPKLGYSLLISIFECWLSSNKIGGYTFMFLGDYYGFFFIVAYCLAYNLRVQIRIRWFILVSYSWWLINKYLNWKIHVYVKSNAYLLSKWLEQQTHINLKQTTIQLILDMMNKMIISFILHNQPLI